MDLDLLLIPTELLWSDNGHSDNEQSNNEQPNNEQLDFEQLGMEQSDIEQSDIRDCYESSNDYEMTDNESSIK
ncbi:19710_t:CDS:2 [Gigaspora margarita]|uniref:19710_t:CDS:1 n=1 Tax=Gigaspora margarita TaxID=4874 RepID=A0ABN7USY7_GIGMA|nr:19710_t:CDS:2 [Gigaspora margarita]